MAQALGVDDTVIRRALERFQGLWRRQEVIGTYRQATVISDYGHHPREIAATIQALRSAYPQRRMFVIFQPHRQKRFQAFLSEFKDVLKSIRPLIVVDVYEPPGEDTDVTGTSRDLVQDRNESDVVYASTWTEAQQVLDQLVKPNDLIVTFTAGDLDRNIREIVSPL
jgi:UDP-N-acetylmuramate--alanine ligase